MNPIRQTAHVFLWGEQVGTVASDGHQTSFAYAPSWCAKTPPIEPSPLMMPVPVGNPGKVFAFGNLSLDTYARLPGMLADSLPDQFGRAVWQSFFRARGREIEDVGPVERLTLMGARGMGALTFKPDLSPGQGNDVASLAELREIADIAQAYETGRAQLLHPAGAAAEEDILKFCGSGGGAHAKALLAFDAAGNIRSGQVDAGPGATHWILKLDGLRGKGGRAPTEDVGIGRVELAYSRMAAAAGIDVPQARIFPMVDKHGIAWSHFMAKRFDRQGDARVHTQTLCGMAHLDKDADHAYETFFGVLNALGMGQPEREQLFRRMAFNALARVADDHTKNFSFMLEKPSGTTPPAWRLAPAYDLVPSTRKGERHRSSINGKTTGITQDDLLAVAAHAADIKRTKASKILGEVAAAVARWPEFAAETQVPEAAREAVQRILPPVS